MGRWLCGLVASATLVLGCASAAPPEQVQQSTVGDGGSDFAGQQCVDGADCMTGNQGACGKGHVVCQGGVASCVPASTTQSCYSGSAATRDVGACKSGMQTCIGSLGACGGEVLPATVENCFNDLDDDCDGKVNNGCPNTLTTGTPRALTAHGNTGGGAAFSARCPAGTFVSKAIMYADEYDQALGGIDVYCATPTLVRGASAYSVTQAVSATAIMTRAAKVTLADTFTFDCGTTGFVPAWYSNGRADSLFTDALGVSCATTVLTLSATNQLSFAFTKQAGGGGYYGYTALGTAFEDDCAQGEVLIGFDGRKGNGMDSTQAVCAPLTVVYK